MRSDLEFRMKQSEDSVMIVNLGRAGESSRFLFLGHHERLPTSSAVIVLRRERSGSAAVAGERSHADRRLFSHLDKSICVRQPAACAKPLAQRPVPAGQVARILRAVIPPPSGGLHCGVIASSGRDQQVPVIPPLSGGLHCGWHVHGQEIKPAWSSSRPQRRAPLQSRFRVESITNCPGHPVARRRAPLRQSRVADRPTASAGYPAAEQQASFRHTFVAADRPMVSGRTEHSGFWTSTVVNWSRRLYPDHLTNIPADMGATGGHRRTGHLASSISTAVGWWRRSLSRSPDRHSGGWGISQRLVGSGFSRRSGSPDVSRRGAGRTASRPTAPTTNAPGSAWASSRARESQARASATAAGNQDDRRRVGRQPGPVAAQTVRRTPMMSCTSSRR